MYFLLDIWGVIIYDVMKEECNMRAANFHPDYPDGYKTKKQWAQDGFLPIDDNIGSLEYTNGYYQKKTVYYTRNQVRKAAPDELEAYMKPYVEHRRKLQRLNYIKRRNRELLKKAAASSEIIPCTNPSGVIVFDVETTGMYPPDDEILQISIIDGEGNTLINELVHPCWTKSWNTQHINGISPEMVADAPLAYQLIPKVKGIFESASTLISYNGRFDLDFLRYWGIDTAGKKEIDVMLEFAPVYGEWNEEHNDYKWQSLVTCAKYYGYEFKAHDSLEDVRATLFCWRKMEVW